MKNTFNCCFNYKEMNGKVCTAVHTDFEIEKLSREEAINFYYCMEKCIDMIDEMFVISDDDGGLNNIYEI